METFAYTNQIRTYSLLSSFQTFEDRFKYLILNGVVGEETFGWSRYLNQMFYNSPEWKKARAEAIVRDNGNDLGVDGFPINGKIIVHHLNPITKEMIYRRDPSLYDLENLICVSHQTHNAITYNDITYLQKLQPIVERKPNDTCPWRI